MELQRSSGLALTLGCLLSMGVAAGDCEGGGTPTVPPLDTPTPTPTPAATPTACLDGSGLCDRQPNTSCVFESFAEVPPQVEVERAFAGLSFSQPVFLTHAPGDSSSVFVLEKAGRVRRFNNDQAVTSTQTFLDITDRVSASASEMGLLGMAFHPDYPQNGYVYMDYTAGAPRRTVISRFTRSATDPTRLDPDSELVLLQVDQPFSNHNGGMVTFGPDGYLYVGLGDGGSGGDPEGNGQNPNDLLATLLRLDVDNPAPGLNYGWPDDNPFVDGGGRPEVFAWGLRNPWRFSFDALLGTLWVGDVGQDAWEEVDVVVKGGNYGWNTMEGLHCYSPANGCDTTGLILPLIEYSHSEGRSITGGYVYRGTQLPELYGRYIYGDYTNGRIWAATYDGEVVTENIELVDTSLAISAFGEGPDGELFVLNYSGGTINRFKRATGAPAAGVFPTRLSETGCFTDVAGAPAAGVYPYAVRSPLWSDGDIKRRWFALPGMDTFGFEAEGAWQMPDGGAVFKEFAVLEDERDPTSLRRLETRLLLKLGGEWRGYTYRWNAEQTDALLLDGALSEQVTTIDASGQSHTRTHLYPSRADCQSCHTAAAGFTLGLRTGQLNRDFDYHGVVDNQLSAYEGIGLLGGALPAPPSQLVAFEDPSAGGPAEPAARSYMEANCAHCHLPGGPAAASIDLRYATPLSQTGTCGQEPGQGDLGVAGALILDPGDAANSTLSLRVHTLGEGRMPPLASYVVDPVGTAVIDAWINGLTSCP